MRTHPVAPLNEMNRIYYQRIERAKRKLRQAQSADERINARNVIGEATAMIWRLKRKEKG